VLVVGDGTTLKVHVHTDVPDEAAAVFADAGAVSRLDVADMREQVAQRSARLGGDGAEGVPAACGVLAVVAGTGMRELFADLGARTLDGGSTLNPSTYELLAGIHGVPAEAVVVLPNSANTIMAAERAADLSEKDVRVMPTRSQPAGLAALFAFDPDRGAEENRRAMEDALAGIHTGAVAEAARDDGQGRFRRGESVGFVDDELVAWGAPTDTLAAVLGTLGREAELITCLTGEGAPLSDDAIAGLVPDGVELEVRAGGQPSYWWQLSAE
jgi:dihydroxyacetone kinase-like predicted kinase